jgi:hypothetical protein
MAEPTHSGTAMPPCWTPFGHQWPFGRNASGTWTQGQPWVTHIW